MMYHIDYYGRWFVILWVVHLLLNMEEKDAATNGFPPSVVKQSKLAFRVLFSKQDDQF